MGVAKCNKPNCRELVGNYWSGNIGGPCNDDRFLPSSGYISGEKRSWCMVDINPDAKGIKTWSITNLSAEKYVLIVRNSLDSDIKKKCSGNPICRVNGGSDDCKDWLSCSDSDYLIVP